MDTLPKSYIDRPLTEVPLPPGLAAARIEDAKRIAGLKLALAQVEPIDTSE